MVGLMVSALYGLLTDLATEILEHARDMGQRFASGDISPSATNLKSSKPDAARLGGPTFKEGRNGWR